MRILILNDDLMTRQAAGGLSANGHQVTVLGPRDSYLLSPQHLRQALDRTCPDVCLMRNRRVLDRGFNPYGLELDALFLESKIPHVCWFTENPLAAGTLDSIGYFYSRRDENCLVLCFSPESAMRLRALGHNAEYLPLAATLEWFQKPTDKKRSYLYKVSFVGRPKVKVPAAWRGKELSPLVNHTLAARQQLTLNHFQKELLPRLNNEFLKAFEKEVELELEYFRKLSREMSDQIRIFLEDQLITHLMFEAARLDMLKIIRWLLDAKVDLKIFGGEEWGRIFPQLGETPQVPFQDQAVIYSRSRINLVISKLELGDVVHERIFNIGACGGFALAEHRDAILDLFPDGEIPTFKNREELLDRVREYLQSEKKRKEIAQALYERVMREHTFQIRMEQVVEKIKVFLLGRGCLTVDLDQRRVSP